MTDAQRDCARSLCESGQGRGSRHGQGNWNASAVSFADPIDDSGQGGEGKRNVSQWTNAQPSPTLDGSQLWKHAVESDVKKAKR